MVIKGVWVVSREKVYTPPPPPPHFGQKTFFRERGGGVYFEAPRGRILYPLPLLYAPPLEGYFQGWGGGGV